MKKFVALALALCMTAGLAACSSGSTPPAGSASGETASAGGEESAGGSAVSTEGKEVVTIWRGQGTDHEEALYNAQIDAFNAQSDTTVVEYEVFPYNDFGTTVRAAISTNSLADIIYVDGTEVGNLVFLEALAPLDEYLDSSFLSQYADSAFYEIDGSIYGAAQQDGGLAFWANKAYLEQAGVRIATYEEPWDRAEFLDALEKLQALEPVEFALDMKTNWGGGYVVYAWQPLVTALGADWYNHDTLKAGGALDSPAMVEAMTFLSELFEKGYVDPNETIDTAFVDGTSALDLTGHWNFNDYSEALGEDLILIPLPDLGSGSFTGIGGLPFAATSTALERGVVENCAEFIKFALGEEYQNQINDTNGSLPVLKSALESTPTLKEDGPLYLYAQQLVGGKYAVRPMSAAFPTYQAEIGTAVFDILAGSDVQESLEKAASAIDKVIEENGY